MQLLVAEAAVVICVVADVVLVVGAVVLVVLHVSRIAMSYYSAR